MSVLLACCESGVRGQSKSVNIEFVNHASVVLDTHGVRMLCDPWITGRAFDNGWALLSESQFSDDDYAGITHIWFSHEHPDHFSVPSLRSIPEQHRNNITVLFQETRDKKVVGFCRKMGFKEVQELPLGQWQTLAPNVELYCQAHTDGWGGADSWLCTRTPEATVLNINDCDVVEPYEAEAIARVVGEVDVLLTQFSYASWQFNKEAVAERQTFARNILGEVAMQASAVKARYLIPFASFVWFCHRDNFYLNADVNRIDAVRDFLANETSSEPIIMYPGDQWTVGTPHDSDAAIERYLQDYQRVAALALDDLPAAEPVPLDELTAACEQFQQQLVADASPFVIRSHIARYQCDEQHRLGDYPRLMRALRFFFVSLFPSVPDTTIYLDDYEQAYRFGLSTPLQPAQLKAEECDIRASSESLLYAFKNLFGGQSLAINGRFQECRPGGHFNFFRLFKLSFKLNEGDVPKFRVFGMAR